MSADLSQVLPGWRGTDPDGGTWVRTPDPDDCPWHYMDHYGEAEEWRSQEEAEAAGLVPLIPAPDGMGLSIDLGENWGVWGCDTLVEALTALGVEPGMDLGDVLLLAGSSAAPLAAPAPLGPGAVSDADRVGDAETFLAHWAGGGRVSAEDREDFIAAWTGWHRGTDFDRECAERDAKEALDAYVSALAVERAELTAALADARSAAPAPLDPGNPEHLRQVAEFLGRVPMRNGQPREAVDLVRTDLGHYADNAEREQREAEQDAADRKLAARYRLTVEELHELREELS